ncbi:MAG: hypothetical protein NZL91_03495 [Thermoflexales bacterium]|nr:hypothetical protein [Thermoflexales bacterium]MCS7325584.1 hypothetical protein [Thermoflexales bacterium]MCX7940047.1 hypothetical protein [Thermoflexales bacterium]MDW8053147.1 hypothetical protein [Anaerolineae bacterium]MDW8291799.1 hypothetical protein [Anaerolineae bacterium]
MKPFLEKLHCAQQTRRSWLGIALDILTANTPLPIQPYDEPMLPFARAVIEATADLACAYVVNPAFYLAEGAAGVVALERIVRLVPSEAVLIFDSAFAGAEHDAYAHARAAFEAFRADAATLAACVAPTALTPFLGARDKGIFFWCETTSELAQARAKLIDGAEAAVGFATSHAEEAWLRAARPDAPESVLLIRTDAAEMDYAALARWGKTQEGVGALVIASHAVIYASRRMDFADQIRAAALARVQAMRMHGLV